MLPASPSRLVSRYQETSSAVVGACISPATVSSISISASTPMASIVIETGTEPRSHSTVGVASTACASSIAAEQTGALLDVDAMAAGATPVFGYLVGSFPGVEALAPQL